MVMLTLLVPAWRIAASNWSVIAPQFPVARGISSLGSGSGPWNKVTPLTVTRIGALAESSASMPSIVKVAVPLVGAPLLKMAVIVLYPEP